MTQRSKRTYSSQFKTQLVLEYLRGVKSQAEICREQAISPNLLHKWCAKFKERVPLVFDKTKEELEKQKIAHLEQIIGRQQVEIDFLKRGLRLFGA